MQKIRAYLTGLMVLATAIIIYSLWALLLGMGVFIVTLYLAITVAHRMRQNGFGTVYAIAIPLLVAGLGVGLGGTFYGLPPLLPASSGLPLLGMMLYPQLQHQRLVANYRRKAQYLIQP